MHFDFLLGDNNGKRNRSPKSGPIDGSCVLSFGEPNLVLVDLSYTESVETMKEQAVIEDSRWTLLYADGTAQLWGLSDVYDDPNCVSFVPQVERLITDKVAASSELWPALPTTPNDNTE